MPSNDLDALTLSRRSLLGLAAAGSFVPLRWTEPWPGEAALWRGALEVEEMERFGFPAAVQRVVEAHAALKPIANPWKPLVCKWSFALGLPSEGLHTGLSECPPERTAVELPHRTLPADTPFWYRSSTISLEAGAIAVQADDGAQLWIGSRRVAGNQSVFVFDNGFDNETLTIRVLNKAMYGGLSSVLFASTGGYRRWTAERALRERADLAILKLKSLRNPSRRVLEAAERWADRPSAQTLEDWEGALGHLAFPIVGPSILSLSPDRADIVWHTDRPSKQILTCRVNGGPESSVPVSSDRGSHRAELSGLPPKAVVAYRINGGDETRFRSLPAKPPFRFTVWGDAHVGGDRFRQVVAQMLRDAPAFTVGVGDAVDDATNFERWRLFFEIGSPLFQTTPMYLIGGNHEYDHCFEDLKSPFYEAFALRGTKPWYAWSVANCRFVALDPNVQFPTSIDLGSEQYRWLVEELESRENRLAQWRFLLIHQPPFSQGWTGYEGDLPIRQRLEPLIERYKIDFVISGHTHDYERLTRTYGGHPCTFLVVGGAGGGLEDGPLSPQPKMDKVERRHHYGRFTIEESRVVFEAIASDATCFDTFVRQS